MTTSTYDDDSPHWPSLEELGGGQWENETGYVPNPVTDPDADSMNQHALQIFALASLSFAVALYVTFPGGVATISQCVSVASEVTADDFTIVENAAGNTSITHTGGLLPPSKFPAGGYLIGDTDTTIAVIPITNGVQVKTRTGGTLADAAFVVLLTGIN